MISRYLAALTCLLVPVVAVCSNDFAGYKITKPIKIDGTIDPEEWGGVPTAEGSYDSLTGDKAPESMQFWMGYDEKYIYFAARMHDSTPGSVHATQYQTNVSLSGDDYIELDLDLTGSLAAFNTFAINPRGATSIALAGGRAFKREWNGDFLAASRMLPDGWETEARIPWQILNLPSSGARNLRFNLKRNWPKQNRQYNYVYAASGRPQDIPVWAAVVLPKKKLERTLKLLPYVYAGYDQRDKTVLNSGLDLKMPVTDNINFVGSINPDFRNIENQILSLDFSRFERLVAESRPFFQEGSQYSNSALFASQRIKGFDVGVNTYGRISDKSSFSFINTTDFAHENDLIANVTYDPTPVDSFRVTAASLERPTLSNEAYLARYNRQFGPYSLFVRTMGSKDSKRGFGDSDIFQVNYFQKEWNGGISYNKTSPNFFPRLGFAPEVDYKGIQWYGGYDKPFKKGSVAELSFNAVGLDYAHVNGDPYRRNVELNGDVALRQGLNFNLDYFKERFEGVDDHLWTLALNYPRDNIFKNARISYATGRLEGDPYNSISAGATYRFGNRLQLTANYQVVRHRGYEDQLIFSENYDLGRNQSLSGRLVKRGGDVNGFLSYRRAGNRGAEYYLIVGDPNSFKWRNSIILKVVLPFEFKLG